MEVWLPTEPWNTLNRNLNADHTSSIQFAIRSWNTSDAVMAPNKEKAWPIWSAICIKQGLLDRETPLNPQMWLLNTSKKIAFAITHRKSCLFGKSINDAICSISPAKKNEDKFMIISRRDCSIILHLFGALKHSLESLMERSQHVSSAETTRHAATEQLYHRKKWWHHKR